MRPDARALAIFIWRDSGYQLFQAAGVGNDKEEDTRNANFMTPERTRLQFCLRWCAGLPLVFAFVAPTTATPQNAGGVSSALLPDSPQLQTPASGTAPRPLPCVPTDASQTSPVSPSVPGSGSTANAGTTPGGLATASPPPCPAPHKNWYQRFADGPQDKPLTPRDKAWLAARNVVDPFNVITILGEAGISVASNPDSPYGPGMPGYARYVGVSTTQDMTGEFFGTFLIPSLAHQDPHYHRMARGSIARRVAHSCLQVIWTQSDYGQGMPNYANIFGFAIDDEISNLYVPGRATNASATAERYGTAFATAPIGNLVSEFLPDVARHVHVQVVVIQRIINQVAKTNSGSP